MRACCKNKSPVEKNFSRYAEMYDAYADVQCLAAGELIKKTPERGLRDIIDIGCGTGNYTIALRHKFNGAAIKALDISDEMVRVARRKFGNEDVSFIVADAERFDPRDSYDLVTSNAAFQWFNDLERSLERYKNALTPEGSIVFSIFGPLTFWELGQSLKEALGPDAEISSNNFSTKERLAAIMERYFRNSELEETVVKKRYGSLEELLRHIKYTGARGGGITGISQWSRNMLDKIEEAYMSRIGMIEASYQIFYCRGAR